MGCQDIWNIKLGLSLDICHLLFSFHIHTWIHSQYSTLSIWILWTFSWPSLVYPRERLSLIYNPNSHCRLKNYRKVSKRRLWRRYRRRMDSQEQSHHWPGVQIQLKMSTQHSQFMLSKSWVSLILWRIVGSLVHRWEWELIRHNLNFSAHKSRFQSIVVSKHWILVHYSLMTKRGAVQVRSGQCQISKYWKVEDRKKSVLWIC